VKAEWLRRLAKKLPKNVLIKSWPKAPKVCQEASVYLKNLHEKWLARNYVMSITPERKRLMEEKVIAEELFKNKKSSYESSIAKMFESNRLNNELETKCRNIFENKYKRNDEKTFYCLPVIKYDRHGYKTRSRILLLTNSAIYILDEKDMKPKHRLPYKSISAIVTSSLSDGILIIKIPTELKHDKGDLILDCNGHLIEAVTKIAIMCGNDKLNIVNTGSITHLMVGGKQGQISFGKGMQNEIIKRKDGILQVNSVSS
jgi:myosin-1